MYFSSDNWAGAHPKIAQSLSKSASGYAVAYGNSEADRALEEKFSEIFGRKIAVFFVGTGTAANALSMTAVNRPGGVIFCHPEAHLMEDECGAPEYFTGGARLCGVPGSLGRMDPGELERAIRRFPAEFVHNGQPMAVSITQSTEIGTIYDLDEIAAIAAICRRHSLPLHMDGARFANALVALDVKPAEMTAACGVDIISFGGTKNGCWCAEAIIFLDPDMARDMPFLRKRSAHLFSKTRFITAQFSAYLDGGLWLENARWSNAMATRLAAGLEAIPAIRLAWRPQTNEVFPIMKKSLVNQLQSNGAFFYEWPVPRGFAESVDVDETLCRFVTSFATTERDIDKFCDIANRLSR